MKQMQTRTVAIGENTFFIRPFPAFKAANILGQLTNLLTPIIGGLLPLAGVLDDKKMLDLDLDDAAPALAGAFSSISGDKLEVLLKQLLIDHQNISFESPDTGKAIRLTEDLANEVFCGDTQDMLTLAIEVIKLNFNGFFTKLANQFGSAFENLQKRAASMGATGA